MVLCIIHEKRKVFCLLLEIIHSNNNHYKRIKQKQKQKNNKKIFKLVKEKKSNTKIQKQK